MEELILFRRLSKSEKFSSIVHLCVYVLSGTVCISMVHGPQKCMAGALCPVGLLKSSESKRDKSLRNRGKPPCAGLIVYVL